MLSKKRLHFPLRAPESSERRQHLLKHSCLIYDKDHCHHWFGLRKAYKRWRRINDAMELQSGRLHVSLFGKIHLTYKSTVVFVCWILFTVLQFSRPTFWRHDETISTIPSGVCEDSQSTRSWQVGSWTSSSTKVLPSGGSGLPNSNLFTLAASYLAHLWLSNRLQTVMREARTWVFPSPPVSSQNCPVVPWESQINEITGLRY